MGLTVEAYQRLQMALLPPGRLWRFVSSALSALFLGAADELERLDVRTGDLLREAIPATAVELLPDFEAMLDIVAAASTAERQANIVARLVSRQRYRPVDFQNALASLLAEPAASIQVIEHTHAFAASLGDYREIFRFFIYRDPTLPGTYYLAAAQALVDAIKPSHTVGLVIESIDFLYDDPHSLYDRDLLGV